MASKSNYSNSEGDTVFTQILRRESPAVFLHEDDQCAAIKSNNPRAPVHFLVIPKKPIEKFSKAADSDEQLLGHMLIVAKNVSKQQGIADDGYRITINDGDDGAQAIYHLHMHVMGGRQMSWPPG